jgi:hypothetical protein
VSTRRQSGLGDRAPHRLANKDEGVLLGQQRPEGGVERRLADIGAEKLVEGLAVPFRDALHPHQRALAALDREDRHSSIHH